MYLTPSLALTCLSTSRVVKLADLFDPWIYVCFVAILHTVAEKLTNVHVLKLRKYVWFYGNTSNYK